VPRVSRGCNAIGRSEARVVRSAAEERIIETSAGGVVVRRAEDAWEVLVIRDPYGNWGLPKGHVEGDETLEEAAVREVQEETGIVAGQVGPLVERIDWFFRKEGALIHKYCSFFLMRSDGGIATPEKAEGITECAWLPLDEATSRIVYDNTRAVVERSAALIGELGW